MKNKNKNKNTVSTEILTNEDFKLDDIKTIKVSSPVITLNEYLSKYHGQRILDSIITKWYRKKDPTNPEKTRDEWDVIANSFQNETEK